MLWEVLADAIRATATGAGFDDLELAVAVYDQPARTLPAGPAIVVTPGVPWLDAAGTFGNPEQRLRAVALVPASFEDRLESLYRLVDLVRTACDDDGLGGHASWTTVEQPSLITTPDGVEALAAVVNVTGPDRIP